jgi:hypothetical protein
MPRGYGEFVRTMTKHPEPRVRGRQAAETPKPHRDSRGRFTGAKTHHDSRKQQPNPHKLTEIQRNRLPASDFALPDKRQYPIPDRYHAELALQDLHNASLRDQVRIREAIRKKFPGLI